MSNLETSRIFVFGSNLAGIHGAGAAKHARLRYGAIQGKGIGHHGQSYGIPTKNANLDVLGLRQIEGYVNEFIIYCHINPHLQFNITQIGCGLAGYMPMDIAPMFNVPGSARTNMWFDVAWEPYLNPGPTNFWKGPI